MIFKRFDSVFIPVATAEHPAALRQTSGLWGKKCGLQRTKKKTERNPLPAHAVSGSTCQRGPLWLSRAPSSPFPTLHLLIHSLACSPFFPSGFHLVQTLEHHQHLLCVGQRPRVRPWAWTKSLRHSCLSSTGSVHFLANPVQIYATVLLQLLWKAKLWTTYVYQYIFSLSAPILQVNSSQYSSHGLEKHKKWYICSFIQQHILPISSLVVLELMKPGTRNLTGRHLNEEERKASPLEVHLP